MFGWLHLRRMSTSTCVGVGVEGKQSRQRPSETHGNLGLLVLNQIEDLDASHLLRLAVDGLGFGERGECHV